MDFDDAKGCDMISGAYFSLGASADIAPLLQGLDGDLCQSPHWGCVLEGKIIVTYADGQHEVVNGGGLFPGHPDTRSRSARMRKSCCSARSTRMAW